MANTAQKQIFRIVLHLCAIALVLGVGLTTFGASAAELKSAEYRLEAGKLIDGPRVLRVKEGDTLELTWRSAQAAEIHLHGYNILINVPAGGSAEMRVDAKATGRFPITLHGLEGGGHSHKPLAYLEVHPK